jgi:hypothetical protein
MATSQTLPAHVPNYMRFDRGVRADMAYVQAKGVAATTSMGVSAKPASVQQVHLQNWLQAKILKYSL